MRTKVDKFSSWKLNENENDKIDEIIDELKDCSEKMQELKSELRSVYSKMRRANVGNLDERFYRYILGHFEPLVDSDHEWMTKSESIESFIEDLKDYREGAEEDED